IITNGIQPNDALTKNDNSKLFSKVLFSLLNLLSNSINGNLIQQILEWTTHFTKYGSICQSLTETPTFKKLLSLYQKLPFLEVTSLNTIFENLVKFLQQNEKLTMKQEEFLKENK